MTTQTNRDGGRWANPWRIAAWGLGGLILLLPLVAMQFTGEVKWDVFDFVFATVLIFAVGIPLELAVRLNSNGAYRFGAGLALAAGFLTVWANGAVGMIGSEDNAYNLLFLGVIVLALVGSAIARFKAGGMAKAMVAAAAAQAALAAGGMPADLRGGIFSMGFAIVWLLAAVLFRRAARA